MQSQDGGRSGDQRSDGKLVLVNAAAGWRRVDFWFRVADCRDRRVWECSREMAREGYIAKTVVNLFQRKI